MAFWNILLPILLLLRVPFLINGDSQQKDAHLDHLKANKSQQCHLPSILMDKRIVIPIHNSCNTFEVLRCYCLTADECIARPCPRIPYLVIGKCIYGCFKTEPTKEYQLVKILSSHGTCSIVKRNGILCGECMEGYGVPAYSFSLKCVHCGNESLWTTIPRYVLVAYGPLTLFLAMIVVFTVSVNSAPLRGWILVCQIVSNNMVMYVVTLNNEFHTNAGISPYFQILTSVYGVWNLDFFRSVYKPFCLHPSLTTLQVMSLDYIIAAYPLVLIVAMYVMVELYSRNFRPMVLLGRLLHHCCIRFRHRLNIRTSLIDAFGTFFSLSFVKFLSTTANLLASAEVWDNENKHSWRVYIDGSKETFKGDHIPYAITATLVLFFCNILPLVLMLLYSFPRGQIVLNILPGSVQRAMYPFVDNILACYKDGTNGTRNCRYFAVVYYFALFGALIFLMAAKTPVMLGWNAYACIVAGMLVAVIQPYKSKVYNTVDIVLTLSVGLCFVGAMSYFIAYIEAPFEKIPNSLMFITPLLIPMLYILGYLGFKGYRIVPRFFKNCLRKTHQMNAVEADEQALLSNSPKQNNGLMKAL